MSAQLPDFNQLQQSFLAKLDALHAEQLDLIKRTNEVNNKFEWVIGQLADLGYQPQEGPEKPAPLSREEYRDHLQTDIQKMDAMLHEIHEGKEEVTGPTQQHLAAMLTRLHQRKESILQEQTANQKVFTDVTDKKKHYVTQFSDKSAISALNEQEVQQLLMNFLMLFEEEDQALKKTEFHLVELNHLLDVKEQLLTTAENLIAD